VLDLIRSPGDYERWYERYAAGIVFRLGYGKPVQTGKEPYVERSLRLLDVFEKAILPGAYLVDVFPALMHILTFLAPFKRHLLANGVDGRAFFKELQDIVRREKDSCQAPPSLMNIFLEHQRDIAMSDAEGGALIGTMYGAGVGTTGAALMSFTLTMVLNPLWLQHMQDELDKVVGSTRLLNIDDLELLPTVIAVVKETLRWRPVTAGGIPHQLIRDDVYEDMFFPAGTIVHFNEW
jgi:cytochrome P450